jgi:hypothetical protein
VRRHFNREQITRFRDYEVSSEQRDASRDNSLNSLPHLLRYGKVSSQKHLREICTFKSHAFPSSNAGNARHPLEGMSRPSDSNDAVRLE